MYKLSPHFCKNSKFIIPSNSVKFLYVGTQTKKDQM
jgi:hypothetical protein